MHKNFLIVAAMVITAPPAGAWEATRNGPLLDGQSANALVEKAFPVTPPVITQKTKAGSKPTRHQPYHHPHHVQSSGSIATRTIGSANMLSRRTVEYPQRSGARLADGWDFITNTRLYSQCIDYGTAFTDKFQQATLDYKRSVDDETFSVALNINTSANVSGGFDGFSGHANGSFNLESSYKLTSKDDVIIAHASVVNGAQYVTAQKEVKDSSIAKKDSSIAPATEGAVGGVRLNKFALDVLGENRDIEAFRAACGDGFIAAIGTGADLYLLYHFAHLDTDTRLKITTSMEAGGGVSGLFTAGGSFGSNLNVTNLVAKEQLGIYYVQNGGKIAALPTKLEDIADRVSKLPGEALDNGKPLYVIVVPYSELYNWPLNFEPSPVIELRLSLVRYLRRLRSAFAELQAVISDFRTKRASPSDFEYLHDSLHRLRAVDYADLGDKMAAEIKSVEDAIRALDGTCIQRTKLQRVATDCRTGLRPLLEQIKFDDFNYLVQLPVPRNAIRTDILKQIVASDGDIDDRRFLLSMELYKHWIERIGKDRCALFFECMNHLARIDEYDKIKKSINNM